MNTWEQLTIYIDESDQWQGKPLFTALVESARQHKLSGATVMRSVEGYGARHHHQIHTAHIMELEAFQQAVNQALLLCRSPEARHLPGYLSSDYMRRISSEINQQSHWEVAMKTLERLTIYVGESDQRQGKPVFIALVEEARKRGVAGATVTRGLMGYGKRPVR